MSHLKERKEHNCLNCKADLVGRYCHVCGQENLEPKETVWHLLQHFFNDITHFDGKFFSTVKYLVRKPGYLSAEYMAGRRASYLNPIRMYVFTSAIFFLLLFATRKGEDMVKMNETPNKEVKKKGLTALAAERKNLESKIVATKDAEDKHDLEDDLKKLDLEMATIRRLYGDTTTRTFSNKERALLILEYDSTQLEGVPKVVKSGINSAIDADRKKDSDDEGSNFFGLHQGRYKSLAQYDSVERALPDSLKDGWFKRQLMRKLVRTEEEYHSDKKRYLEHFSENLLHSFPKILFFSLPFFALFLNIMYFRHKQYYYADHGIFSIHVYCATFLLGIGLMILNAFQDWAPWSWLKTVMNIATVGIVLYMFIYLYKAMRGFYRQRRAKTFLKYFLVCVLSFILNMILFLVFLLITAISV